MSPDKGKTLPRLKNKLSTELHRLTVSSDWLYSLFHKQSVLIFQSTLSGTAITSSLLYGVSVLFFSIEGTERNHKISHRVFPIADKSILHSSLNTKYCLQIHINLQ